MIYGRLTRGTLSFNSVQGARRRKLNAILHNQRVNDVPHPIVNVITPHHHDA